MPKNKHTDEDIDGEGLVDIILEVRDGHSKIVSRLDSIDMNMNLIKGAFAGGDLDGHRRYHETAIEMMVERRKFYANMKDKALGGLIWAGAISFAGWSMHKIAALFVGIK